LLTLGGGGAGRFGTLGAETLKIPLLERQKNKRDENKNHIQLSEVKAVQLAILKRNNDCFIFR